MKDINLLLDHLHQLCETCCIAEKSSCRGYPELIVVAFPDAVDLLITNLIREGQSAALQLKHFEYAYQNPDFSSSSFDFSLS